MAEKIIQRHNQLQAIESVEQMIQYSIGRCHRLKGNRSDEYSLDLIHPYRLLFKKDGIEDNH